MCSSNHDFASKWFATCSRLELTFQLFQPSAQVESLSVLPWQCSSRCQCVDHEAGTASGQSHADQWTSKLINVNRIEPMTNWGEFIRQQRSQDRSWRTCNAELKKNILKLTIVREGKVSQVSLRHVQFVCDFISIASSWAYNLAKRAKEGCSRDLKSWRWA